MSYLCGINQKDKKMEKMLFNSEAGNLFEILQNGGGPNYKSYTVELWDKKSNKWIKSGIYFKDFDNLSKEELINLGKQKVQNSIYA